jgi:hypothetical protein
MVSEVGGLIIYWIEDATVKIQCHTMKMEQTMERMMECLLAEIRTNKAKI